MITGNQADRKLRMGRQGFDQDPVLRRPAVLGEVARQIGEVQEAVPVEARDFVQFGEGALQEMAGTTLPRRSVGEADVAQKPALRRASVAEIDVDPGLFIGDKDEVAGGAEGSVADRAEARDHGIGRDPADPGFHP